MIGAGADFDLIVAGGGHAGIEAALAAARMGVRAAMMAKVTPGGRVLKWVTEVLGRSH